MQRFIGIANYMSRCQPSLAMKMAPMQKLMIGCEFRTSRIPWSTADIEYYAQLCKELADSPLLHMPMVGLGYVLTTDASTVGYGAMLEQKVDGKLRPIAFVSKCTSSAERNYSASDLEAKAIIFGLSAFRCYVTGVKVTVLTDHRPLSALFLKTTPSARMYRWCLILQQYDITIQCRE